MPQAVDAQSIVDEVEEFTPEENFNSGFDDIDEPPAKVEVDEFEVVEEPKVEEPEKEEEVEDGEEKEELSALELAEKQAREKFLKKDEKLDDQKEEPKAGAEEKKVDEPKVEIDFTDVDTDPAKFVNNLVEKITDAGKKTRLKETLDAYPEIGEIAALISRELVGRQTVKYAEGAQAELPEDVRTQLEALGTSQKAIEDIQFELAESRYFKAIEKEVPGAWAISESEKFVGWLGNQSVGINTLAGTGDPADGIAVMKAYKEYEARSAAKVVDDKTGKRKAKVDSSMKPVTKSSPSRAPEDLKDDFNAGFNE